MSEVKNKSYLADVLIKATAYFIIGLCMMGGVKVVDALFPIEVIHYHLICAEGPLKGTTCQPLEGEFEK